MKKFVSLCIASLLFAGCAGTAPAPTPSAGTVGATVVPEETVSAIVGTWKLGRVEGKMRGESEKRELNPEENASVYGDLGNIYTYNEDGTMVETMMEAGEKYEENGTWTSNEDGSFTVDQKGLKFTYVYESSDDSLRRTFEASSPGDRYTLLEFIYLRQK